MILSKLSRVLQAPCVRKFRPVIFNQRRYAHEPSQHEKAVGGREQITYGWNGEPCYADRTDFPFPSVRYKEASPEILALKGKERGDWRLLSIEEKRQLYRANFCLTFSEFKAPTGEWKSIIAWTLFYVCLGVWMYIMMQLFVYNPLPDSFSQKNRMAQMRRQIDLEMNPITGISSEWDYENRRWKKTGFFTPPNPFINPCTGDYREELPYNDEDYEKGDD